MSKKLLAFLTVIALCIGVYFNIARFKYPELTETQLLLKILGQNNE